MISKSTSVILLFLVLGAQFGLIYAAVYMPIGQGNLVADIIIALLTVDLCVAIFHWYEDAYLEYTHDVPLITIIAKANEMHHYRPRMIVHESYFTNIQESVAICIIYGIGIWWLGRVLAKPPQLRRLLIILIFGSFANLIHRFSHEKDCERPAVITWLQKWLFVSREQHRIHHNGEEDRKFGVVLKHTNYIYDTIGIWLALELVLKAFGIHPNHKSYYVPDYDNDVILTDDDICQMHTDHDVQEWKNNLHQFHALRGAN